MAFDPSKYKPKEPKALPVILLLDVSGSMYGEKIQKLYDATVEMIKAFSKEASRETTIRISIITFGSEIKLHTSYMLASDLDKQGLAPFVANGGTPMGITLRMAKDMIEDKSIIPSNVYKPAVVLVSDGMPDSKNEAEICMDKFMNEGRSKKCQRFAIPIGPDADKELLLKFAGTKENLIKAEDADDIVNAFTKLTMSVSTRARSENPNMVQPNVTLDDNTSNSSDEDSYI